ncbi:MAG TPA: arginyltransferase [Syntrophales bacterium]|nr:arginyltransferase [Syntrophales bacterium]
MNRQQDFIKDLSTVTRRVCLYFPETIAPVEEAFLWNVSLTPEQTDEYLAHGWRHVSWYFYRNSCSNCRRCLPIRVPVDQFKPSKSQRRVLKKNVETEFKMFKPVEFALKHIKQSLSLYNRFLDIRYDRTPRDLGEYYNEYFVSPAQTLVSALFINGELVGNGFLDLGKTSLSTIYFAFDPRFSSFSPGTFSILKEIEWASQNSLRYYYLGYYICEISAMRYKGLFRPFELLDFETGQWKETESDISEAEPRNVKPKIKRWSS